MKEGFMPAPVLAASDLTLRLRAGEAAIIPTDTLPGLAVSYTHLTLPTIAGV